MFLIRISCCEITHSIHHYHVWLGWVVSVNGSLTEICMIAQIRIISCLGTLYPLQRITYGMYYFSYFKLFLFFSLQLLELVHVILDGAHIFFSHFLSRQAINVRSTSATRFLPQPFQHNCHCYQMWHQKESFNEHILRHILLHVLFPLLSVWAHSCSWFAV